MYNVETGTPEDFKKVKKTLWRAFEIHKKFDEKEEDWDEWSKEGVSRSFVIREDDTIVASMTLQKYDVLIRGTRLPFNGIGAVATEPTHRRKGLIHALFKTAFQSMYDSGEVYSMLDPFKIEFYEKFGYASSEILHSHNLTPSNIRSLTDSMKIREAKTDDAQMLYELQKKSLQSGSRVYLTLSDIERRIKGHNCYIVKDQGSAVGWFKLYFQQVKKDDRNELKMILSLAMFYTTVDVLHNILSFIKKFDDQVSQITVNSVPEIPIRDYVKDRSKVKTEIQGSMMIRIVDFMNFCKQITIPKTAVTPVVLRLEDAHCDWNSETYKLIPENGRIIVETTDGKPDLVINDLTLSRIVGGLTPATLLFDTNMLQCDRKVAEDLEAIFPGDSLVSFIRF
ncbi:MAG: GNAT family N-acetyltransferase [Candidatus Kariarchaeaceae archaeon]|jgi:predicted acetyltransferase